VEAGERGEESDADVGLIWTLDNGGFACFRSFAKQSCWICHVVTSLDIHVSLL
jgi:hypothetical protein